MEKNHFKTLKANHGVWLAFNVICWNSYYLI